MKSEKDLLPVPLTPAYGYPPPEKLCKKALAICVSFTCQHYLSSQTVHSVTNLASVHRTGSKEFKREDSSLSQQRNSNKKFALTNRDRKIIKCVSFEIKFKIFSLKRCSFPCLCRSENFQSILFKSNYRGLVRILKLRVLNVNRICSLRVLHTYFHFIFYCLANI